jgi:hypothetical protein
VQTDLRQVVSVTSRFRDLQGLKQVFGGVVLLLVFAWSMLFPVRMQDVRTQAEFEVYVVGAGILAIALVTLVVGGRAVSRWYDREYGHVSHTRRQRRLMAVIAGLGLVGFLVPFEIEIVAMNAGTALPFNVMLAGLSMWIVGYWLYLGRQFPHYLVIASCGFALSVVSMAGLPPNGFVWHLREAVLFMAVASIGGGLIDHRILARALGSRTPVGDHS